MLRLLFWYAIVVDLLFECEEVGTWSGNDGKGLEMKGVEGMKDHQFGVRQVSVMEYPNNTPFASYQKPEPLKCTKLILYEIVVDFYFPSFTSFGPSCHHSIIHI